MINLPLQGMIVLDFSQYLSGPSAGLRLADFGARVIKIERPNKGDAGRKLAIKNLWVDEDSLLFHTINRNKESFTADIKNAEDKSILQQLIAKADVVIHNFRPGVMEKNGLGFTDIAKINPQIIYATISGYGNVGPWKHKPGQDLLLQSITGLTLTTGDAANDPVPFGTSIADILSGAQLVQGILAASIRKQKFGVGALVEVTLIESMLDFQFELLTTYYTNNKQPERSLANNGHTLLGAPYGIYKTSDGFIALAMIDLKDLADAISCCAINNFTQDEAFVKRDEIKAIIAKHLATKKTKEWLVALQKNDLWANEVLNWQQMKAHDAYNVLQMEQSLQIEDKEIITTRCPIRINEKRLYSNRKAPKLGEHNKQVLEDLLPSNGVVREEKNYYDTTKLNGYSTAGTKNNKLIEGITVIDFSQFLSGPSAALRLADFGANVIKIERPETGDICRHLYVSDVIVEDESTIFHAINRNKKSYVADLKNEEDVDKIKILLSKADVLLHNFRPGVMERLGLDYETIKKINPSLVYAEISGYSNEGPWRSLPGQDLLLQAVSGLSWLSNNKQENPTPMGVAVADIMAGTHVTQGILAALHKKNNTGKGSLIQVSMLESILDFQFETLTCFYNDGNELPERSAVNSAHPYIAAPYGIYKTSNGYLALAMNSILVLADLLNCPPLLIYNDSSQWFALRDEIKKILVNHLHTNTTEHWLGILEKDDIWCAPILNYNELVKEEGYKILNIESFVETSNGLKIKTTRCPIKIDGEILTSNIGAPQLGEHNQEIDEEFGLIREYVPVEK